MSLYFEHIVCCLTITDLTLPPTEPLVLNMLIEETEQDANMDGLIISGPNL